MCGFDSLSGDSTWRLRSMIIPEGRILAGLDEFMLRLGHLTVTCVAASESAGSRYRLEENLKQRLVAPTIIDPAANKAVAEYLLAKNLIPNDANATENVRYPDLRVVGDVSSKSVVD